MSLEHDLVTVLHGLCQRVHPDEAPVNTPAPFVTWQHIGGDPLRYVDGTAADKRLALLQIDVFDTTKAGAMALAKAIEDALCAAAAFSCTPVAGMQGRLESELEPPLHRLTQEFQVLGAR